MLTLEVLRNRIEQYQEGLATLEDLSAWAEQAFRDEQFDPADAGQILEILSVLRDTTDPHRFRWEEPDWDALIDRLER